MMCHTGRDDSKVQLIESYMKSIGLFRDYSTPTQDPQFTSVVELDLSTVAPSISGPKRPHDRVSISGFKEDFQQCLVNKVLIIIGLFILYNFMLL